MTKAPTPTEMSKGQSDNTKKVTKSMFHYILTAPSCWLHRQRCHCYHLYASLYTYSYSTSSIGYIVGGVIVLN